MAQSTFGERLAAVRAQSGGRLPVDVGSGQPSAVPASGGKPKQAISVGVAKGAVKGAGGTAFNLGRMVHNIPGLGNVTDMLAKAFGPEGTDPSAVFGHSAEDFPDLKPQTGAEQFGKGAEQLAEFMLPAGPAREAAIEGLVSRIPGNAPAATVSLLNKGSALAGRTLGEAGSAAGVSMAHDAEDPEQAAMVAGAGPLLGAGLGSAVKAGAKGFQAAAKTKGGQQVIPYLSALATSHFLPFTMPGVGAAMGTFGLARMGAKQLMKRKLPVAMMGEGARRGVELGSRATAGLLERRRVAQ